MDSVSMVWGCEASMALVAASMKASRPSPSLTKTTPGLVQNWPAPSVRDPAQPAPICAPRAFRAPGRMKTGLIEPNSP